MQHSKKFCLAVCALFITGAAARPGATAEAYRKMSEGEIKAKVTGMEITDEAHFSEQYMRDGTVRIVTLGRRVVAKWTVKQGQLCIEAPRADDSRCAEVWVAGRKVQLRVPGDRVPYDVVIQKQQPRDWK
jgi:hypothetical protein